MAPYILQKKFRSDKTSKEKSLNISNRTEDLCVQMKRGMYIRLGQNHLMKNLSGQDSILKQNLTGLESLKINQTAKSKNDNENVPFTLFPATETENQNNNRTSIETSDGSEISVSSTSPQCCSTGFDDSFVTIRRSHLSQNFNRIRDVSSNDFNKNNTLLHSTSKDGRNFAPNSEIDSSHELDTEDSLLENCQFIRNLPFTSNSSTPKNSITKEGEENRDTDSDGVEDIDQRKASKLIHRTIMKRRRRRKEKKNVLLKLAVALIELSLLEN